MNTNYQKTCFILKRNSIERPLKELKKDNHLSFYVTERRSLLYMIRLLIINGNPCPDVEDCARFRIN